MIIKDIGELGLIETIVEIVDGKQKKDGRVSVGIGDDTAVVIPPDTGRMLITTDTMVENVHFNMEYVGGEDIGYKAIATNLSDIAAMAGRPDYATVTLGLPRDTEVEFIREIYKGVLACAGAHKTAIVGGDLTKSPRFFITVCLTGRAEIADIKLRSYAKPGDVVMVTGALGGAGAALKGLKAGARPGRGMPKSLFARYARPSPRLAEGRLAAQNGAGAIQDISDGLLADLKHICRASGCGANIRLSDIPVFPELKSLTGLSPAGALRLALTGGEDYELIITAPPENCNNIKVKVESDTGTAVTAIGEIREGAEEVEVLDAGGRIVPQKRTGYEHFTGP